MFSRNNGYVRAVFALALAANFFLAPWWLTGLWGIAGLALFPYFFEIVLLGVAFDSTFYPAGVPVLTTVTLSLLGLTVWVRYFYS